MISRPLVKYILTAAFRDKLIWTFLLMIGASAALAVFLGSSSIVERGAFSLVFGAAGLRFLSVVGLVLFCSFYIRRAFETKEVEFMLSRPLTRLTFLFSHAAAFMLLALLVTVITAGSVFALGRPDIGGFSAWAASIGVENMIMAVSALFFSMVLASPAGSALAALGFYVFARLIGTLLGIAAQPPENAFFAVLNNILDMISIVVPRLDLMGQTSWLVYGVEGSGTGYLDEAHSWAPMLIAQAGMTGFILLQGVFFIVLLLAASAFDFSRKQF